MIHSNENRKMNLLLVSAIGTASIGIANQSSAYPQLPTNPIVRVITFALAIGIPSFIRLYTKGTPKELEFKKKLGDTWSNFFYDWTEILKVWNVVLQPCEYKTLFDKRWIGTELSLLDKETKEISKGGLKEVIFKSKKIKCLPTGICGTVDAYVFKQFEKLYKTIGNIETALILCCLLHGKDIEKFAETWLSKKA